MAVTFRLVPHAVTPGVTVAEILDEGKVVGAIYPTEKGVKIVSSHIKETAADEDFSGTVLQDDGAKSWPPIPAVLIKFNPSPWLIAGWKIIKINQRRP